MGVQRDDEVNKEVYKEEKEVFAHAREILFRREQKLRSNSTGKNVEV